MTKKKILYILIFIFNTSFGQDKNCDCNGLPMFPTNTEKVNSLSELPYKIQSNTKLIFQKSMTDFAGEIKFCKGQIIDLAELFNSDSIGISSYSYVVPKYQLFFELTSPLFDNRPYCFRLYFDEYGQILDLEWAKENYNLKSEFISYNITLTNAKEYAKNHKYLSDEFIKEIRYDDELDKVCWYISFLQKSSGDVNFGLKEYKTIVVDVKSGIVQKELDTKESWSTD